MGVLAKPIPFGKYFLLEKLNTGGMAEVFKAKTFGVEGFERIVAVKKILPSIAEDKEFISMFIDEAKIAGQLSHANIAQIFDLGNINDEYYIALEYVPGHDLRVIYDRCVRQNRKLDIGCVCYIISKICEGLDYAHNKKDANGEPMNIIHRDISPQNILISYEGDCKLIDFGIAKATNKTSATQVGILKGKFSYMSPEQVSGKTNIDRRSDIFALGIVLFEMLTLKRLFLGASDFETLEKIRKVEVSPPTLYNSDIPEELEDIVLKALEKDVTQRYQTANELQEAIQRFMFKANIYYTAKDLSEFMHSMFAQEIALEQKKSEFYKELTCDVLAQSQKPSLTPEDETSFYEKQNVPKMSGVQYEVASSQPAPKQAIYAELDGFEPPRDNIVYSPKAAAVGGVPGAPHGDNLNDIVSASVTSGRPHAVSRKSAASMDAVVINKGRETIMAPGSVKKKDSRGTFIKVAICLVALIMILAAVFFVSRFDKRNGVLHFAVYPDNVKVGVEINHMNEGEEIKAFDVSDLSTTTETHYRITAPGYKVVEGSIQADSDGENVEIQLQAIQQTMLKIFVGTEGATVTVDGVQLTGQRHFETGAIDAGEHLVKVSRDGYKTEEKKVMVKDAEQLSLSFDLKPAVAALVIKTEPYEAKCTLQNLRTGESQTSMTGTSGYRIQDLPVDDDYKIIIEDGPEKTEISWKPKVLSVPNEEQIRLFTTKHDPHAEVPKEEPKQEVVVAAPSAPAAPKTVSKPKSEPKPKEKEKEKEEPPKVEPKPAAPAEPPSDAPGLLQVAGKPPCTVFVNGKEYGTTPQKKIELAPGTYTVKCVGAESTSEKTVTLAGGDVKKVMFNNNL